MSEAAPLLPRQTAWLLAAALATLAPHAIELPIWLVGLCASLLGLRAALLWRRAKTPPQSLILCVAVAAALAVRLEYGQFFGKDPGIALLAALMCLKLLECRSSRDARAAVLLGFFLQLGLFLYNQTPPVAALALLGCLLTITALLALEDPLSPPRAQLRSAAVLTAQGLPFMLALFVLFPRVQGPLWGLPTDAYSGMSGLSETMSPGSISQLGLSEAIAFRAEFRGAVPRPVERYWRGPVLTHYDGRTWRPARAATSHEPIYEPAGRSYDYRLTLEPHNQRWLLALDFPAPDLDKARYASDFRLLSELPVRTRSRFDLRSYPETRVGLEESAQVLAEARRLPENFNPRSRSLAQELAGQATSPEELVARTLQHIKDRGLTYTLSPAALGVHAVDEFLFDTREGFCEHFASAFVFLMRAAGIPARVVTGYQGGEINPVDRSLVVRQSDAHAWAEVWLAGRGWTRVDPTAQAAPERVESGLGAAVAGWDGLSLLRRPGFDWLRSMRHRWDALSNSWNQWVLGYNPDRQRELLERVGFAQPDWQTLTMLMSATAATLVLLLFAWAIGRRGQQDALDAAWTRLSLKLGRKGVPRHVSEGPLDYGRRLALSFPSRADELRDIAEHYAKLRYGTSEADPRAVREFVLRIRRLKI